LQTSAQANRETGRKEIRARGSMIDLPRDAIEAHERFIEREVPDWLKKTIFEEEHDD